MQISFHPSRIRSAVLAFLLVGIAATLSGCANMPGSRAAFEADTKALYRVVYRELADVHITPIDMPHFTQAGLQGMTRLAPDLTYRITGDRVALIQAGSEIDTLRMPGPTGTPEDWAGFATRLTADIRYAVPPPDRAPIDEVHEAFLASALLTLDRFSRYAGPADALANRSEREGFGGIGVEIENQDDGIRIAALDPHAPAAAAGLRVGDQIRRVDGVRIAALSVAEITQRLRGPIGSSVSLLIARDGKPLDAAITLQRVEIVPNTVFLEMRGNHAIIRVSSFNKSTADRIAEAVADSQRAEGTALAGLIIDLRGNLGGLLDQSVSAADLFLTHGTITRADGRNPSSHQLFIADAQEIAGDLPIIVVVNGGSASASEILASALQDNGRAVIVGMSSFGKGSIQKVIELPNGGELYVTWAKYLAPSGYSIDRLGVMPTICTSGAEDAVATLNAAMTQETETTPDRSILTRRRHVDPSDEDAVRALLALCPWTPHASGDIDLAVAELLLDSPTLMRQALRYGKAPANGS